MRRFAFVMLFTAGATLAAVACGGSNDTGGLFDTSGTATDAGHGGTSDANGGSKGDAGSNNNGGSDSGNGNGGKDDAGNSGGGDDAGNSGFDAGSTGVPCTVGTDGVSNDCNMGEACISPNCATGFCAKVVTGSSDYKPVCGCDKVNYWNIGIAADNIAGIKSNSACGAAGSAQCSGLSPNAKCPVAGIQASCAFATTGIGGGTNCTPSTTSVCWVLPSTCPTTTTGVQSCVNGNQCTALCDLIKSQTSYIPTPCTIK